MTVLGSFAYSWTRNDRPARLDAALTAPEINIDRVHAVAKAIVGDTEFRSAARRLPGAEDRPDRRSVESR